MLNLFGYDYELVYGGSYDDMNNWGQINLPDSKIRIATNLTPQQITSTILHEILEAINFHLKLGFGEETIVRLETALYDTLTTNGVDLNVLRGKIDTGEQK